MSAMYLGFNVTATHSGCLSILLPHLNSCPPNYIPNLATIKIPDLLFNHSPLSPSTAHPWFVSTNSSAMWCGCLVRPARYARRTLALTDVSQYPEGRYGPINPGNTWWAANSNKNTQMDACSRILEKKLLCIRMTDKLMKHIKSFFKRKKHPVFNRSWPFLFFIKVCLCCWYQI